MKYVFFILFCLVVADVSCELDLNKMQQPFVLETKRIHIPGYKDAFNPSIIRWKGKILMSFRSRHPATNTATRVGFVWLDDNFDLTGKPSLLEGVDEDSYIQDPRLIMIKDQLFMAYSDLIVNPKTNIKKRSMCLCELAYDGKKFSMSNPACFFDFDGDLNNKFEKNWVPFNYQDVLLLAYSIAPHKIFLPLVKENRCVTIALSADINPWSWGILRGGTTALLIDNHHYLAFFHSSIPIATQQSQLVSMPHYFMGAYLFENQPPFGLKKISPTPIVHKDFYTGEAHPTWKPLKVVFPCGFIFDDEYIWVSYGRQDYEAWIVKFDRAKLLKSLIPVESSF